MSVGESFVQMVDWGGNADEQDAIAVERKDLNELVGKNRKTGKPNKIKWNKPGDNNDVNAGPLTGHDRSGYRITTVGFSDPNTGYKNPF
jgi:hypothetical protein